jgi:hypothetical protein
MSIHDKLQRNRSDFVKTEKIWRIPIVPCHFRVLFPLFAVNVCCFVVAAAVAAADHDVEMMVLCGVLRACGARREQLERDIAAGTAGCTTVEDDEFCVRCVDGNIYKAERENERERRER